ncbi:MAG: tetratricopeptide repeat protein [Promethearchaeota archaeon]
MAKKRGLIFQGIAPIPTLAGIISSYSTEYLVLIVKVEEHATALELIKSLGFELEVNSKIIIDSPYANLDAQNFMYYKGTESDECIQMGSNEIPVNNTEDLSIPGVSYLKEGKLDEAITAFNEALKTNPNSSSILAHLGDALWKKGSYNDVIKVYNKMIKLDPENFEAYNNLGLTFSAMGQFNRAIMEFRQAIQINPNFVDSYLNLGSALQEVELYEEAFQTFKEAVRITPDDSLPHYYLAMGYYKIGMIEDAINECKEVIKKNPEYMDVHELLGYLFYIDGELDDAIKEYEKVLQTKPDYAEALYNLGNVLISKGKFDDGIREYKKSLISNQSLYQNFMNQASTEHKPYLIKAYKEMQDTGDNSKLTEEELNKAIEKFEKKLNKINVRKKPVKYAEILKDLGDSYLALANLSSDENHLESGALGSFRVGDKVRNLKNAIESFNQALEIFNARNFPIEFAITQMNLGNAYYSLSEFEDARINLSNSLKVYTIAIPTLKPDKYPQYHQKIKNRIEEIQKKLSTDLI